MENIEKALKEFSIIMYGKLTPYNDVLSKGRCRIFYKGHNRNGGYITEKFAMKLLSSINYTPVKGIYSDSEEDYTDHGAARDLGRIYGIVPVDHNFAWEDHLDKDGVTRTYACVDVLVYTGLYKEAQEIMDKGQSMELYPPSIKGEFQYIEGRRAFVYEEGCFLGLQVLGDDTEPCFEGAEFFSLKESLQSLLNALEKYEIKYQPKDLMEEEMVIDFKLSDSQKLSMLFNLLNPSFNEEGGWVIQYSICDVYDAYCVAYNYEAEQYERVNYTKDDSNDSVVLGERKVCYIVDVTAEEKKTLETIQALNGGTYEKAEEVFEKVENLEEKNSEFEHKIEEQNETISTLSSEKESVQLELNSATEQISELSQEVENLKEYKLGKEKAEKQEILGKYALELDEEVIKEYTEEKLESYSLNDLEKELAFELVKASPNLFTKNNNPEKLPKPEVPIAGINGILEKYRK